MATETPTARDHVQVVLKESSLCYQCAKCSAGCPVAQDMDMLPHQVMHLVALGMEDRVLGTSAIWQCAGCFTCAVRCPNDINITAVMDRLRQKAIEQKIPCKKPEILEFHRNFLRAVGRGGRIHELRMMGEYGLRTKNPFRDMGLGIKMFFKGRLNPLPPRSIRGFKKWMAKLWKA